MNYRDYFPYKEVREEQDKVLTQIFDKWYDKKYFILQLEVGIGKSGIAKTLANYANNSFIITATKQLQDQYIKDFRHENNMVSIKGKSNYICNINEKMTCENAVCSANYETYKNCKSTCKYYSTRNRALFSKIALTSYSYIFKAFETNVWKTRDLMIFDECHLLENQLTNYASFKIIPSDLQDKYELFNNMDFIEFCEILHKPTEVGYENNRKWVETIYELLGKKQIEMHAKIESDLRNKDINELDEDDIDFINSINKDYGNLLKLYKKIRIFLNSFKGSNDWLITPIENGLEFTPIFVKELFTKIVDKWANKFVFMSATILDIDNFIDELGINRKDVEVINIQSNFPSKNSPIVYLPCGKMDYKNLDNTMPNIIKTVDNILSKHPNEQGIIHTGNYKIAKAIYEQLNNERLIIKTEEDFNNEKILEKHMKNKNNSVLISPSLTTGVDLKDDLSRFQIIVKMPFLSLADNKIKTKINLNNDWYVCEMLKTFVQSCGRSTRSKDDWSITYVLDSSLYYWISKYSKWLNQQFLNRFIWKKEKFKVNTFLEYMRNKGDKNE